MYYYFFYLIFLFSACSQINYNDNTPCQSCQIINILFQNELVNKTFKMDIRQKLRTIHFIDTTNNFMACTPLIIKDKNIIISNSFLNKKTHDERGRLIDESIDIVRVVQVKKSKNEYLIIFIRDTGGDLVHASFSCEEAGYKLVNIKFGNI